MSENKSSANSFLSGLKEESSASTSSSFTKPVSDTPAQARSTIGKGISFRGELIGTEDLHIEGKVEGTVIMAGQNLSIGKEGELNANIHVQNICIHGNLTGDVLAEELIEIKESAIVKGNLIAPRIQLEDGGKFRGSMDMIDSEEEKRQRNEEFKAKLVHPHLPQEERLAPGKVDAKPSVTQSNNQPEKKHDSNKSDKHDNKDPLAKKN
ncbi:bactofilin family protein [Marinicellulosiphila megalodicopiae]|uniref:bactofilin family protein n=1 Tax=Marinicellulosiphila megalodicopiae TaxID=2724896 RepID=UPI003BAFD4A9